MFSSNLHTGASYTSHVWDPRRTNILHEPLILLQLNFINYKKKKKCSEHILIHNSCSNKHSLFYKISNSYKKKKIQTMPISATTTSTESKHQKHKVTMEQCTSEGDISGMTRENNECTNKIIYMVSFHEHHLCPYIYIYLHTKSLVCQEASVILMTWLDASFFLYCSL